MFEAIVHTFHNTKQGRFNFIQAIGNRRKKHHIHSHNIIGCYNETHRVTSSLVKINIPFPFSRHRRSLASTVLGLYCLIQALLITKTLLCRGMEGVPVCQKEKRSSIIKAEKRGERRRKVDNANECFLLIVCDSEVYISVNTQREKVIKDPRSQRSI